MPEWQQYEREIEQQFRVAHPTARITHNAQLPGKFSKVERQIDLLIEEQASDFSLRIVVDAKFRGRKIDVGEVEAFLGMMRDVEAHVGMMIALEGYTQAAINRAHHDDLDAILDVLNLDELKEFQGFVAIPYSGNNGVAILAPFGWVVDATRREGVLAYLYQRGLTFERAIRSNEFMYINFWNKDDPEIRNLEALLNFQESYLVKDSPATEINLLEGVKNQKVGARTLIRRCKKKEYPVPEYTGLVDFDKFIFMCVLFSPIELERKNLRKLRSILREVFPMQITKNNTAAIEAAQKRLSAPLEDSERASILSQIGYWYRDMGKFEDARGTLEQSLSLVTNYSTLKQLISVLLKMKDKDAALVRMGELVRLDPHNPTVFDDCMIYARGSCVSFSDLLILVELLRTEHPGDDLVQANCDFYSGKLLLAVEPQAARKRFIAAERSFRKVFPGEHQVFSAINKVLRPGARDS